MINTQISSHNKNCVRLHKVDIVFLRPTGFALLSYFLFFHSIRVKFAQSSWKSRMSSADKLVFQWIRACGSYRRSAVTQAFPQQKWESQQINTVLLWLFWSASANKKKKSQFEKTITSLCHEPEGMFSVSVQRITTQIHIVEKCACFGWNPNWEESPISSHIFVQL